MDIVLKLLNLMLSGSILYVGHYVRRVSGTWLTPASIWCVGWFLLTFIPLLAVPTVPSSPWAMLYILVASIAFSLPVLSVNWSDLRIATKADEPSGFDTNFLRISFYGFASVTLVSQLINLAIQGVTLAALFSDFFSISSSLIADRYNENVIENVFAQIANASTYITVGLAGLLIGGYRSIVGKIHILVISMTPALLVMTVAGAKGTIFLCIALLYAGTLVRRLKTGDNRLIDLRTLARALVLLIMLLPFLLVSFLSRGLYGEAASVDLPAQLYRNIVSYSSAHIYAFSDWFSWYVGGDSALVYAREDVTGGFFTFMSIFRALGSERVVPVGFYDEYFQYDWFLQTNIYTIFRGAITDFTLIGSIVFMFLAGVLANLVFVTMAKNKNASWSIAGYICFCGFAYSSFLISIFVWNSMYPMMIVIGFLLTLNNEFKPAIAKKAALT